jgi:hypothetical protein
VSIKLGDANRAALMRFARKPKLRKMAYQERRKRTELAMLRARYDSGAVHPAVYGVIRTVETNISWREHRGREVS